MLCALQNKLQKWGCGQNLEGLATISPSDIRINRFTIKGQVFAKIRWMILRWRDEGVTHLTYPAISKGSQRNRAGRRVAGRVAGKALRKIYQ